MRTITAFMAAGMVIATSATAELTSVPAQPTYAKDVAPIFFENCANCHRAGQVGPMSLLTYDEVRPWAKSIQKNVADGQMPP